MHLPALKHAARMRSLSMPAAMAPSHLLPGLSSSAISTPLFSGLQQQCSTSACTQADAACAKDHTRAPCKAARTSQVLDLDWHRVQLAVLRFCDAALGGGAACAARAAPDCGDQQHREAEQ